MSTFESAGGAAVAGPVGVGVHPVESRYQLIDSRGVTGELGEILDAVHHPSARVRQGEHQSFVGDEVFHV